MLEGLIFRGGRKMSIENISRRPTCQDQTPNLGRPDGFADHFRGEKAPILSAELSKISPAEWEKFNQAKERVGFTRPWRGIPPEETDIPGILHQSADGEVVIPSYTLCIAQERWNQIKDLTESHISALLRLGRAILAKERQGIKNGILPSLRELGFSRKERDVLLARPDITDLFILSRTDLSGTLFNSLGEDVKRYETNCAQPGAAEVVDYFALPDAIQGNQLPVVGRILQEVGINNHRVLPRYIEAISSFWRKHHPDEEMKGVLILSGGYGFGTRLLEEELQKSFTRIPVYTDKTIAPRPTDETKGAIAVAAETYAQGIRERFILQKGQLIYHSSRREMIPVSIVLHEPRLDIEHFTALSGSNLMAAWKRGRVEIINPPQARVCGSKITECYLANEAAWEEMAQLGFALTKEEKSAEQQLTIPATVLTPNLLVKIERDELAWKELYAKPANAGSGRGILSSRQFESKEKFLKALSNALEMEEPYIVMEERQPAKEKVILHHSRAPEIFTPVDIDPYAIIIPGEQGSESQIVVPGAVSRAFLPLVKEEEMLAEKQGIKLNCLGPKNEFSLPDGTNRQFMIMMGNVAVC